MTTGVTLVHTADSHRATFDAVRDRIAPGADLTHVVRCDWLARARDGVSTDLANEIAAVVRAAGGPVLCTCTTIGAVAEAAGALRVDGPMMQAAAGIDGPVVMAYCLDSTWQPSLSMLERALAAAGHRETVHPLCLAQYWPLFEAGETEAFTAVIAGEIRQAVVELDHLGCVVLAQASMAGAAALLSDLGVPVLSSPELALRAVLDAI